MILSRPGFYRKRNVTNNSHKCICSCTIISKILFPTLTEEIRCGMRKVVQLPSHYVTPKTQLRVCETSEDCMGVCTSRNLISNPSNFSVLWEITSFEQNPGSNPAGFRHQQLCSPQTSLQAFSVSSCYPHTVPCWSWSVLLIRHKLQLPPCPLSSLDIRSDAENKDAPRGMCCTAASSRKVVFWGAGEWAT